MAVTMCVTVGGDLFDRVVARGRYNEENVRTS
jgi:hypothetical protein